MFIRTRRLFLRPPWLEDAPALAQGVGDWDVARMLANVPYPYTLADAEHYIAQMQEDMKPVFVILNREGNDAPLIGAIGLHWHEGEKCHELGYWLTKNAWGRGYASEAASALMELAFLGLGLPRVCAGYYLENPVSGQVLFKLGFKPTTTELRYCRARNTGVPCQNLSLTRQEWLDHKGAIIEAQAA